MLILSSVFSSKIFHYHLKLLYRRSGEKSKSFFSLKVVLRGSLSTVLISNKRVNNYNSKIYTIVKLTYNLSAIVKRHVQSYLSNKPADF